MKALPASLRAIALDPTADPERAAGIVILPWQTDPTEDRRRTAEVTRGGGPVALLQVTQTDSSMWTVLLWRDRGRREYRFGDQVELFRWFPTLEAAVADAEASGVAFALGHMPEERV